VKLCGYRLNNPLILGSKELHSQLLNAFFPHHARIIKLSKALEYSGIGRKPYKTKTSKFRFLTSAAASS
jgi:hypothetical protein